MAYQMVRVVLSLVFVVCCQIGGKFDGIKCGKGDNIGDGICGGIWFIGGVLVIFLWTSVGLRVRHSRMESLAVPSLSNKRRTWKDLK